MSNCPVCGRGVEPGAPGFKWVQKGEKGAGAEPGAHNGPFWYLGVPATLDLALIIWLGWRVG